MHLPPPFNSAPSMFFTCLYNNASLPSTALCSTTPTSNLSGRWDIKCWEVLSSGHQKDASWVSHPRRLQIAALHDENGAAVHETAIWRRREWKVGYKQSERNVIKLCFITFHSRATGHCSPYLTHHPTRSLYVWCVPALILESARGFLSFVTWVCCVPAFFWMFFSKRMPSLSFVASVVPKAPHHEPFDSKIELFAVQFCMYESLIQSKLEFIIM